MYEVMDNGQVMLVQQVGESVSRTHFDMVRHVRVTADKAVITANDVDTATVTAAVFDYLGEPVPYDGLISFDVEGEVFDLPATNGKSILLLTSDHQNRIDITAWIPNSRGGGCVVDAKANPS